MQRLATANRLCVIIPLSQHSMNVHNGVRILGAYGRGLNGPNLVTLQNLRCSCQTMRVYIWQFQKIVCTAAHPLNSKVIFD